MLVLDPVESSAAPPTPRRPKRSGGRRPRPWLRWLSTVGVAFVAAVCVLVGPTTTEDAAQAFVPPPVVAAIDELGPASLLVESNPAGMAITAAGILAFLAWENRDTLSSWGHDALCFIGGGADCAAGSQGGTSDSNVGQSGNTLYSTITYAPTPGSSSESLVINYICTLTPQGVDLANHGGGNVCTQQTGDNRVRPGRYKVVCTNNTTGAARVAPAPTGTFRTPSQGGSTTTGGSNPVPFTFDAWTTTGGSTRLCAPGETVARLRWWDVGTGETIIANPGNWTNGKPVPTESRIDVTCVRNDDSRYTVTGKASSDGTFETPSCQPGDFPLKRTVKTRVLGDDDWTTGQTIGYPSGPKVGTTDFGDCLKSNGTPTGLCHTSVFINDAECNGSRAVCWDWQHYATVNPEEVECRWGSHVMPLTDCAPLKEGYRGSYTNVGTIDGGANWYNATPAGDPSPNAGNAPEPNPQPDPNPVPKPGDNPGGDPNGNGGGDPDGSGNCWAAIISWNPVDWVETPIKCAVVWAFVPGDGYVEGQLTKTKDAWKDTAPGRWIGAVGTVAGTLNSVPGGSCDGPALTVSMARWLPSKTLHPFSACADPERTVASIVKTSLGALCWVGTFLACVGTLAQSFGYKLPWPDRSDES